MSTPSPGSHLKRELGLLPLIALIFFSVSGGPHGIEDAVPSLLAMLAMVTSGLANIFVGLAAALTGPVAYLAFARSERDNALST